MNDSEWTAFLDTLTPEQRTLVQGTMRRMQRILNADRVHIDKRSDRNAERIDETNLRIDALTKAIYDELNALASQLPPTEALYQLAVKVEALEQARREATDGG